MNKSSKLSAFFLFNRYVVRSFSSPCGNEVQKGYNVSVISTPSWELFENQSKETRSRSCLLVTNKDMLVSWGQLSGGKNMLPRKELLLESLLLARQALGNNRSNTLGSLLNIL